MRTPTLLLSLVCLVPVAATAGDPWLTIPGSGDGPGKGKSVVLISGDEEYRSEEALPQLAKILSKHHGFDCTVLFAIDPKTGTIDPNVTTNIPGLENLKTADLAIFALRFRDLPDEQMKHVAEYVESGKPIVGLRTSTHAFSFGKNKGFEKYHWSGKAKDYDGGFGRQVLGETWRNHHGNHGSQATRGILAPDAGKSPILRGIADGDIFGPSDVYEVRLPLPGDSVPLVMGQVVAGMKNDDKPLEGKKNDPMMPVAWTKSYKTESGKSARVFTTTMGASQDLSSEGLRRLLVNASYWAVGLEDKIPAKAEVGIVGEYNPQPFRNNGFTKGLKPEDLK